MFEERCILVTDMLQELLKLQEELVKVSGYGRHTPAELGVAIAAEGLELWENEGRTGKGKWWKKPTEDLLNAQKEEAIDILHFWLQLCLELKMDSKEISKLYQDKMKKNLSRQRAGY
jgi:dimeric dUTPase (all-alpha-NTP-PPase superfamily)